MAVNASKKDNEESRRQNLDNRRNWSAQEKGAPARPFVQQDLRQI
jgi:hypothetical protein